MFSKWAILWRTFFCSTQSLKNIFRYFFSVCLKINLLGSASDSEKVYLTILLGFDWLEPLRHFFLRCTFCFDRTILFQIYRISTFFLQRMKIFTSSKFCFISNPTKEEQFYFGYFAISVCIQLFYTNIFFLDVFISILVISINFSISVYSHLFYRNMFFLTVLIFNFGNFSI